MEETLGGAKEFGASGWLTRLLTAKILCTSAPGGSDDLTSHHETPFVLATLSSTNLKLAPSRIQISNGSLYFTLISETNLNATG